MDRHILRLSGEWWSWLADWAMVIIVRSVGMHTEGDHLRHRFLMRLCTVCIWHLKHCNLE